MMPSMVYCPIRNLIFALSIASFVLPAIAVPAPGLMATSDIQERNNSPYNDGVNGERYFQIHPGYDETKCLDVRESGFADGTSVDIFDCNGTEAQNWVIQPGTTQVKVAGQNFCLDAGQGPNNGTKMKIWTCYPGLPAQTWYYTDDKRIALKDQGFCLDLTDGNSENFNVMQVWKCTNGNTNQIWSV